MNPFRPRRIKITQAGFENMTGYFGTVEFKDGISIDPVAWQEQQRLGGLVMFVSAEEDELEVQIGPSAEMIRIREVPAGSTRALAGDSGAMIGDGTVRLAGEFYSREQLEHIADSRGLAGLREIGKAWGVGGRSIGDVINRILEAQNGEPSSVDQSNTAKADSQE